VSLSRESEPEPDPDYLRVKVLAVRLDPDLIFDLFFVCRSGVWDDRGGMEGRAIRG
jgi:hypothetical protein